MLNRGSSRIALATCSLWLLILFAPIRSTLAQEQSAPSDQATTPAVETNGLNAGLPPAETSIPQSTPRETLESFVTLAREGNYIHAARLLNLNSYSEEEQQHAGERIARKLQDGLGEKIEIDWSKLPDSPDGTFTWEPGAQKPASRITFGTVKGDNGTAALFMERIAAAGGGATWVIADDSVRVLDMVFADPGSYLTLFLPDKLKAVRWGRIGTWQWIGLMLSVFACIVVGYALHALIGFLIKRRSTWRVTPFVDRAQWPIAFIVALVLFNAIALPMLGLPLTFVALVQFVALLIFIVSITFLIIGFINSTIDLLEALYLGRIKGDKQADPRARSFQTQMTVARRLITVLLFLIGCGIALSQFDVFRNIGSYLVASAGVAGLVLGLAAQRTLGNVFAGIQVAIAQPVRIGDSVLFEKEWGWIEEISFTYTVIRTWDWRRIVVPINYLLDHPIQNWTKKSPHLIGTVYLYCDYRVPVERLREELKKLLEGSKLWNKEVPPVLQVTDAKEMVVELRALCSANSAGEAWDLRCLVREKMIAFLQQYENGRYLPRTRIEFRRDSRPDGEEREPRKIDGDEEEYTQLRADVDREGGKEEEDEQKKP